MFEVGDYVRIKGGGWLLHGDKGIIVERDIVRRSDFSDFSLEIIEKSDGHPMPEERDSFMVLCEKNEGPWGMYAEDLEHVQNWGATQLWLRRVRSRLYRWSRWRKIQKLRKTFTSSQ